MGKSIKIIMNIAAVLLMAGMIPQYTVYAASQLQSADSAAVSEGEDINADLPGQEVPDIGDNGSEIFDTNVDEQPDSTSDPNGGGQPGDTSDSNAAEQPGGTSDPNDGEQSDVSSGQDVTEQPAGSSDQVTGGSQDIEDQTDEAEDDDVWADGDDEWTDAWSGGDDMEDIDWADDEDMSDEYGADDSGINSEDGADLYDGESDYIAEHAVWNMPSDGYEGVDQNYQTGAGLGNDIFLILAVVCGIMAVGLAVRKCINKN